MLRTGGIVGALALAVPATPAAAPPPFEILRWTAPGAELAALSASAGDALASVFACAILYARKFLQASLIFGCSSA